MHKLSETSFCYPFLRNLRNLWIQLLSKPPGYVVLSQLLVGIRKHLLS